MGHFFEITGNDIAELSDSDLRALIGLLGEADCRAEGIVPDGILWGGEQDAKDGGIDVAVEQKSLPTQSFIPRNYTGFQVKKPKMPAGEIKKEMCPKGRLRPAIKDLIEKSGAYVIVSSEENLTSSALKERRIKAMRDAVGENENFHVDFFDQGRIASWVRMYPSLVLWVFEKIGKTRNGWEPFKNWSRSSDDTSDEYLIDQNDKMSWKKDSFPVSDGIQRIREELRIPASSVRLVGQSGVGKTRFVQALFDERIGTDALDQSRVIYADAGNELKPDPRSLAEQLIAQKQAVIMVIDNCAPELHKRLTDVISENKYISLLTIEYDVRDDLPEETSVYRLRSADEVLIEQLLAKRFPRLSAPNIRTIAEFSGGNSRVALALARTVDQNDDLSTLRNEELFERLFWKRGETKSNDFLKAAMVLSLVYSFDGENITEESELSCLAQLVNKTADDLFEVGSDLQERELVQQRDIWKAVLPQAIANRLAHRALKKIPVSKISSYFASGSERLFRSFSRRLSYLHESKEAIEIATEWLRIDGFIGHDIHDLSTMKMAVLENLAPTAPEATLTLIEQAVNSSLGDAFVSKDNFHRGRFVKILWHIAYDPGLFQRCALLLVKFTEPKTPYLSNSDIGRRVLEQMFQVNYSGTKAPMDTRLEFIGELAASNNEDDQDLACDLLKSALKIRNFDTLFDYSFGARDRDYGYFPASQDEIVLWYESFIDLSSELALCDGTIAAKSRKCFADCFRYLWPAPKKRPEFITKIRDKLVAVAKQLHAAEPWNEGWVATQEIIRFDDKDGKQIQKLAEYLKPKTDLDRAKALVLSEAQFYSIIEDADKEVGSLGQEMGQDFSSIKALASELVTTFSPYMIDFGFGLAQGVVDRKEAWGELRNAYVNADPKKRQTAILKGFIAGSCKSDPTFYQGVMDDLLEDTDLQMKFVDLQASVQIDNKALKRLHTVLDKDLAPVGELSHISGRRRHEGIDDDDLADLLLKILSKDGGSYPAVRILTMRFHRSPGETKIHSEPLLDTARTVLLSCDFSQTQGEDYELSEIVKECLAGKNNMDTARKFCLKIINALHNWEIHAISYPGLLRTLAELQPFVFLDTFLETERATNRPFTQNLFSDLEPHENPLNKISDEDLIKWCSVSPESRYPKAASAILLFRQGSADKKMEYHPSFLNLLEHAPQMVSILPEIERRYRPQSGWSGSFANQMQMRADLLPRFFEHENPIICEWAKDFHSRLQRDISQRREQEDQQSRATSFE